MQQQSSPAKAQMHAVWKAFPTTAVIVMPNASGHLKRSCMPAYLVATSTQTAYLCNGNPGHCATIGAGWFCDWIMFID